MTDPDRILGALLGAAVGDALGVPVDGLSHQNIRMYYKGVKSFRADEKRGGLEGGQWTAHTQRTFALAEALTASGDRGTAHEAFREALAMLALRRAGTDLAAPTSAAAASVAPLGLAWFARAWSDAEALHWVAALGAEVSRHAGSLAAAYGQAAAVRLALQADAPEGEAFIENVAAAVSRAERRLEADGRVSARLRALAPHLGEFPLDLQDRCNGTGAPPDEAFPFAVAMFARNPGLAEATLLAAVNVGGAASAVGALVGALLGARNGWSAFPPAWREDVEDADRLADVARALGPHLG